MRITEVGFPTFNSNPMTIELLDSNKNVIDKVYVRSTTVHIGYAKYTHTISFCLNSHVYSHVVHDNYISVLCIPLKQFNRIILNLAKLRGLDVRYCRFGDIFSVAFYTNIGCNIKITQNEKERVLTLINGSEEIKTEFTNPVRWIGDIYGLIRKYKRYVK